LPRRRDDHYDGASPYGTESKGIISSFRDEYAFLSNFYVEPFECGGKVVMTAEHAFQAQKARGQKSVQDLILRASTPSHAKRLGRRVRLEDDWNDRRIGVMRGILRFKFAPGTALAERLKATYPQHLVEGNTWGDTFWGCVHPTDGSNLWVGANNLGILLMEIRDELLRG